MVNKDINLYDIFISYSYSQLKQLFKNAKTKGSNTENAYFPNNISKPNITTK